MKQWIKRSVGFGCALLALSIAHNETTARTPDPQTDHQQTDVLSLEGRAIHMLVTARLSHSELRKLTTDSRTARGHPDLADYYRGKSDHLDLEAEECQRIARALGDPKLLNAPGHYNIGRNARHYHVIAKRRLSQARNAQLLSALYVQAAQGAGCFACHSLRGRGGKIGPDLANEGARGRSDVWLIGHFKNPRAFSRNSVMPALAGLSEPQLKRLTRFLQYQIER